MSAMTKDEFRKKLNGELQRISFQLLYIERQIAPADPLYNLEWCQLASLEGFLVDHNIATY